LSVPIERVKDGAMKLEPEVKKEIEEAAAGWQINPRAEAFPVRELIPLLRGQRLAGRAEGWEVLNATTAKVVDLRAQVESLTRQLAEWREVAMQYKRQAETDVRLRAEKAEAEVKQLRSALAEMNGARVDAEIE
jgi:hypothetical protein